MKVEDQVRAFTQQWPDARWGPAHIVLEDLNLRDGHIRWCLGLCRAALSRDERDLVSPHEMGKFFDFATNTFYEKEAGDVSMMDRLDWYSNHDRDEIAATIVFLEHLLTIPETERDEVGDEDL